MPTVDCSGAASRRFSGSVTKTSICDWAGLSPTGSEAAELVRDLKQAIKQYIPRDHRPKQGNDAKTEYRRATQHLRGKWTDPSKTPALTNLYDRQLWFERVRVGYAGTLISQMVNQMVKQDDSTQWGTTPLPPEADETMDADTAPPHPSSQPSQTVFKTEDGDRTRHHADVPHEEDQAQPTESRWEHRALSLRPSATPRPDCPTDLRGDDPVPSIETARGTLAPATPNYSPVSTIAQYPRTPTMGTAPARVVNWDEVIAVVDVQGLGLAGLENDTIHVALDTATNDKNGLDFDKLCDCIQEVLREQIDDLAYQLDWPQLSLTMVLPDPASAVVRGPGTLRVAVVQWKKLHVEEMSLILERRGKKRTASPTPDEGHKAIKKSKIEDHPARDGPNDPANVTLGATVGATGAGEDAEGQDLIMSDPVDDVAVPTDHGRSDLPPPVDEHSPAETYPDVGDRDSNSIDSHPLDEDKPDSISESDTDTEDSEEDWDQDSEYTVSSSSSDDIESSSDSDNDSHDSDLDEGVLRPTPHNTTPSTPSSSVVRPTTGSGVSTASSKTDADDVTSASESDEPQPELDPTVSILQQVQTAANGFTTLTETDFKRIADFSDDSTCKDEREDISEELRLELGLDRHGSDDADLDDDAGSGGMGTNKITERWTVDAYEAVIEYMGLPQFTVWNLDAGVRLPLSKDTSLKMYQLLAVFFAIETLNKTGGVVIMDMAGYGKTYETYGLVALGLSLMREKAAVEEEVEDALADPHVERQHLHPDDDPAGQRCAGSQTQCYCQKDGIARRLGDSIQPGLTLIICEKPNLFNPWINKYREIFMNGARRKGGAPKLIIWHREALQAILSNDRARFQLTKTQSQSLKAEHGPDWSQTAATVVPGVSGTKPQRGGRPTAPHVATPTVITGSLVNTVESSNIIILTTAHSYASHVKAWARSQRCDEAYFRPARVVIDEAHKTKSVTGKTAWGVLDRLREVPSTWKRVKLTQPDVIALTATPWSHNVIPEMKSFLDTLRLTHTKTRAWVPHKQRLTLDSWDQSAVERAIVWAKKYESLLQSKDPKYKDIQTYEPEFMRRAMSFMQTFCIGRGYDTRLFHSPVVTIPTLVVKNLFVDFNKEQAALANSPLKEVMVQIDREYDQMLRDWKKSSKQHREQTKQPEKVSMAKFRGSRSPLVKLASSFPCVAAIRQNHADYVDDLLKHSDPDRILYNGKCLAALTADEIADMRQLRMTHDEAVLWNWHKQVDRSPYHRCREELMKSPKVAAIKDVLSKVQKSRFPKYNEDGTKIVDQTGPDKLVALSESPIGAMMMFIVLREFVTKGSKHYMGEEMDIEFHTTKRWTLAERDEYIDRLNDRPTTKKVFEGRKPRILVGTTGQLGTGISIENVRYMIFLEPPSNLKNARQEHCRSTRARSHGERYVYRVHNRQSQWEALLRARHASYETIFNKVNEGHDEKGEVSAQGDHAGKKQAGHSTGGGSNPILIGSDDEESVDGQPIDSDEGIQV